MTTVELLTRAANAAGKLATDGPLDQWIAYAPATARLIKASGPDHWQAIEALFRAMLGEHGAEGDDEYPDHGEYCRTCHPLLVLSPCPSLQVLRPLAEQVLQHLGDTDDRGASIENHPIG